MSEKTNYILFRNDDVRGILDDSLVSMSEIFVRNNVPITHAVEPANLTQEVVDWLISLKLKYPNLIEIVQHGYNHNLNFSKRINGKNRKGEFGGIRTYDEQFNDIARGKKIMDNYFGDLWFPVFTFPYGARNLATLEAIEKLNYKVVNGGVSPFLKQRLFYFLGRLFNREYLLGRRISWNLKYKKQSKLFQIDFCISIIKKYFNQYDGSEMYTIKELQDLTTKCERIQNIGVIMHHRYHNSEEKIMLLEDYLSWLKSKGNYIFTSQEKLFYTVK